MASLAFHARQSEFKYATGITIDTTGPLDADFSGGTAVGNIKDVTISPPEGDVDIINYLGEDSNSFQNSAFEEKSFGLAEISGTISVASGETFETIVYGTATAVTGGYSRYQSGDSGRATNGAFLVTLNNGTDVVNFVFNNIRITKLGDVKVTGTDGHWEVDFTAKCLPADFYEEYKD